MVPTEKKDTELEALRAVYAADPANLENCIRLVQILTDHGWYNEAVDVCKKTLENNSKDYTLLLEYGSVCFKKQDLKEAVKVFTQATEISPGRIEGWNNLGITLAQSGEKELSFSAFNRVFQIEPENPGVLLNMGNYHFDSGNFEMAKDFFERAVKVRADYSDGWFNLGNTLLALRDFEGAKNTYEKALKYQVDSSSIYKNLGYAYENLGNIDSAENSYLKAIDLNKADSGLHVNLGSVYLRQKKFDDARKFFLKAVRLAPHSVHGWMGLRHLALVKGDLNTFIRATLAILPRLSDDILAQSIEILYDLNQIAKAEEILAQADRLGRSGDSLDLQRLLIYQRKDIHSGKVLAIFTRFKDLPVHTDAIRKGLARYSLQKKEFDSAITYVNKMDKPDSASSSILWRALLAQNNATRAKQLVQQYIKDDPEYYDCWFILARIEAERGNRIRAERFLIKALENGFINTDELRECAELKQVFDSLTTTKEHCLEEH